MKYITVSQSIMYILLKSSVRFASKAYYDIRG